MERNLCEKTGTDDRIFISRMCSDEIAIGLFGAKKKLIGGFRSFPIVDLLSDEFKARQYFKAGRMICCCDIFDQFRGNDRSDKCSFFGKLVLFGQNSAEKFCTNTSNLIAGECNRFAVMQGDHSHAVGIGIIGEENSTLGLSQKICSELQGLLVLG